MDHKWTFYCVKSWSTCQKAKAWLSQHGVEFDYRDLLSEPPTLAELRRLAKIAGIKVKDLVNTKSQAYRKIQPDLDALDDNGIAALIKENPRIMVRPVLVSKPHIELGFKEARYQALLGQHWSWL